MRESSRLRRYKPRSVILEDEAMELSLNSRSLPQQIELSALSLLIIDEADLILSYPRVSLTLACKSARHFEGVEMRISGVSLSVKLYPADFVRIE
jgi:hypothetical protein